jgi:hypothetical protein
MHRLGGGRTRDPGGGGQRPRHGRLETFSIVEAASVDAMTEFGLFIANAPYQRHRIGSGAQSGYPLSHRWIEIGPAKKPVRRCPRPVPGLVDLRAHPMLRFQLERGVAEIHLQLGGGMETVQASQDPDALQPPVADGAPNDRAVLCSTQA